MTARQRHVYMAHVNKKDMFVCPQCDYSNSNSVWEARKHCESHSPDCQPMSNEKKYVKIIRAYNSMCFPSWREKKFAIMEEQLTPEEADEAEAEANSSQIDGSMILDSSMGQMDSSMTSKLLVDSLMNNKFGLDSLMNQKSLMDSSSNRYGLDSSMNPIDEFDAEDDVLLAMLTKADKELINERDNNEDLPFMDKIRQKTGSALTNATTSSSNTSETDEKERKVPANKKNEPTVDRHVCRKCG